MSYEMLACIWRVRIELRNPESTDLEVGGLDVGLDLFRYLPLGVFERWPRTPQGLAGDFAIPHDNSFVTYLC